MPRRCDGRHAQRMERVAGIRATRSRSGGAGNLEHQPFVEHPHDHYIASDIRIPPKSQRIVNDVVAERSCTSAIEHPHPVPGSLGLPDRRGVPADASLRSVGRAPRTAMRMPSRQGYRLLSFGAIPESPYESSNGSCPSEPRNARACPRRSIGASTRSTLPQAGTIAGHLRRVVRLDVLESSEHDFASPIDSSRCRRDLGRGTTRPRRRHASRRQVGSSRPDDQCALWVLGTLVVGAAVWPTLSVPVQADDMLTLFNLGLSDQSGLLPSGIDTMTGSPVVLRRWRD